MGLFLTCRHGEPLPAKAQAQLDCWRDELSCIHYEPGYRLHLPAPAVAETLLRRDPVRRRVRRFVDRQEAWVSLDRCKGLFRALRRMGYTLAALPTDEALVPAFAGMTAGGSVSGDGVFYWDLGALARHVPLPRLLALLRTYEELRRLVAGLADLGLERLGRQIEAQLGADELVAAGQIAQSNAGLLEGEALKRLLPTEAPKQSAQRERGEIEGLIAAAVDRGETVRLCYADAQARITRRVVRPLRIEAAPRSGEYGERRLLVAFCELRREERHFRMDRVVDVEPVAGGEAEEEALPPF